MALQTSPATCRYPGIMGLCPGPPEKGGLELGPNRNQNRTRIRVLCQEEMISLESSAQAEALRPDSCIQDQGTRKQGRIRRVKERKERGKGREVNKVSCSLPVRALWPIVRIRRRPGTKGSQLRPLGLVHWQASWPLSTPSGQDVSPSEEESHQSRHLLQEGGPLPGPKLGSCLTLRNELSKEIHVLTKQEILLGKDTQVESSRVREHRRTALPHGSQSWVLW